MDTIVESSKRSSSGTWSPFDIEWHLMGFDSFSNFPGRLKIHDYGSVSIPPAGRLKDLVKKILNTPPDLRIAANKFIAQELRFYSDIPVIIRNNGVDAALLSPTSKPASDDPPGFVYVGTMAPQRQLLPFLNYFEKNFPNHSLTMIGEPPEPLKKQFNASTNIYFTGNKPYWEVAPILKKATYGINYIPDQYPFNQQISTKLLEYCAAGLNIITTDYQWLRDFETASSGNFFKLDPNFENLTIKNLNSFGFKTPRSAVQPWDKVILQSGILEFIEQHFS